MRSTAMRKATTFGMVLAGVVMLSGMALADGPWKSYGKHMKKYHKHMSEAMEEAAEGDWDDYYEEMDKADMHYGVAQFHRRLAEPIIVMPRTETRTYYYTPAPTRVYTRRYYSYGPGYTSVRTYSYSYGW
jgi:hypothetical protein